MVKRDFFFVGGGGCWISSYKHFYNNVSIQQIRLKTNEGHYIQRNTLQNMNKETW